MELYVKYCNVLYLYRNLTITTCQVSTYQFLSGAERWLITMVILIEILGLW